jgi:sn1-specific diacylglycerol lipase
MIILAFSTLRVSQCPYGGGLLSYLFLSLFVFLLSIFCEACLVKRSLVGSIVETSKRDEGLGKYLTAHIILGIMQFILAIIGLFAINSRSLIPCVNDLAKTQKYDLILLSIVVISQLLDISSLVCCCYSFSANKEGEGSFEDEHYMATVWEGRCKSVMKSIQILSCNLFGGNNIEMDLNTVARVLTNFFHHDGFLDVVPSDVVAGIILVRIEQRARKAHSTDFIFESSNSRTPYLTSLTLSCMQASQIFDIEETREDEKQISRHSSSINFQSIYSVTHRKQLDKWNQTDRDVVESSAKYSIYMIAIYTHLLAMYMQPCTGTCCLCYAKIRDSYNADASNYNCLKCELCKSSRDSSCRSYSTFSSSPYSRTIKGDNICGANHAGLSHLTKQTRSELVYASFENDTIAKPFAILLNHDQKSIVITIRGSMSLEDCITDAIADPVEMRAAGVRWGFEGRERYAHGGILSAALHIREEIEDSHVLEKLFDSPSYSYDTCFVDTENPIDNSSVTRNPLDRNPPTQTYAHYKLVIVGHSLGAGIAAILSLAMRAKYPNLHCYGYGMPASVFDWKTAQECSEYVTSVVLDTDLVTRMSTHSMNKLREEVLDCIVRARVHKLFVLQAVFKDVKSSAVMYRHEEAPESDFKACVDQYKLKMSQRVFGDGDQLKPLLYLPGRALHLLKSSEDGLFCLTRSVYTPQYAPTSDFMELEVSPTMAFDHFPDRYLVEITRLWDSWK